MPVGIQNLDGDIQGLFVGGQEEAGGRGGWGSHGGGDAHGVREAGIDGREAGRGVETLAARGEDHPDIGGVGRLGVGGDHGEHGVHPGEGGVQFHRRGALDVHGLGAGEGLVGVRARVGGLDRAGERERTFVLGGVGDGDHGVAVHPEGEAEVAEGGSGVGFELGGFVDFRALRIVEGQRDGAYGGVAARGDRVGLGGGKVFLRDDESVHVDVDGGQAVEAVVFDRAGREQRERCEGEGEVFEHDCEVLKGYLVACDTKGAPSGRLPFVRMGKQKPARPGKDLRYPADTCPDGFADYPQDF